MKKVFLLFAAVFTMLVTNGCNETVPAGTKGKIMGTSGFQPEIYPPSRVWVGWRESMFLMDTTTRKFAQPIKVLLKDKLTLKADIVFRGRIEGTDKVVNYIFNDMKMDDRRVTTEEVYSVYAKQVVTNTAREVISKYNVDEVNQNYARITTELYNAIKPKLQGIPFQMSDVTLGNIQYPTIVTEAIEKAKERRMAIEKEQAQVQIELTKAEGREKIAKAEYRIKMLEAKRLADYNQKIAEGITDDLLALRQLEVQEKMVDAIAANKNVVYMPMDMMNGVSHMKTLNGAK